MLNRVSTADKVQIFSTEKGAKGKTEVINFMRLFAVAENIYNWELWIRSTKDHRDMWYIEAEGKHYRAAADIDLAGFNEQQLLAGIERKITPRRGVPPSPTPLIAAPGDPLKGEK